MPSIFTPTPLHISLYRFVRDFLEKNGFAPMYQEISAGANVPATSVYRGMKDLKTFGYLKVVPRRKRGILLTSKTL